MIFLKNIRLNHIIIFILLCVIGYYHLRGPQEPSKEEYIKIGSREYILLKSQVDTLKMPGDTLYVYDTLPAPPAKVIKVEVPADVDTIAILKDYYTKNFYNNTYPLDSIGNVTVKDTISQNKLISRSLVFDYDIPIIRETITVKDKPINKFYIGGGLNINNSIYGSAMWISKTDRVFTLNAGISTINNLYSPYVGAGIYFRLNR